MRYLLALLVVGMLSISSAQAKPPIILVLGDSLTAGFGLDPADSFPVQLQTALRATWPDIEVINAGVSGDTAADGSARLDWALRDDVTGVIVELGANDALRGLDPAHTAQALDEILAKLAARKIPVLLAGMIAPPNLGLEYGTRFNKIYAELAKKYPVITYEFFLDGVAGQPQLNQADGMHPNAKGVQLIVAKILPSVTELIARSSP